MCFVCPSWLSFILYNPLRKILTDRKEVMDEAGITGRSVVLEVGAGNGFFTEALAGRCLKVYAVELQEGMVRKLRKRVGGFGDKVEIIQADVSRADIGKAVVDVCLLYYSFHEIGRKVEAASNIARSLKPGGRLAIYEPSVEVNEADMAMTLRLFESSGFSLVKEGKTLFSRSAILTRMSDG
jgi:ubiquinone/menaquinone biosynthesis C-methylase UbiE